MADEPSANFGMIGLAVMGRNLALNISDHGFRVAVWNLETDVTDAFVAALGSRHFVPAKTLAHLVASLSRPRRIMMMIKAGAPVDSVLQDLAPLLEPGDIVIDGGNTYFDETRRREADLAGKQIRFVGMGVSGGEEGARHGPSLMPGGHADAWTVLAPVLEAIAAKTDSGPCVTHVGPDGAGHFVKMVHNGIEYGDMQLIAEAYDVLARGAGLDADALSEVFARWNEGPLESFLIELTGQVLAKKEAGHALVDLVLDKAGQKGTGKWTVQVALELAVAIPTISAAVDARVLSSMKSERVAASKIIRGVTTAAPVTDPAQRDELIAAVADALLASKICSYAQGMALMRVASDKYQWNLRLSEMARIWKGGCIIRAKLLDTIMKAFGRNPGLANLLCDEDIAARMADASPRWRRALALAQGLGIPTPAMSASLAYFDSYRTARLPQNLTQAQRDAFGAHTYERTDRPDLGAVHTEWLK
jgi:6-phosphogluconate dehydrogenase